MVAHRDAELPAAGHEKHSSVGSVTPEHPVNNEPTCGPRSEYAGPQYDAPDESISESAGPGNDILPFPDLSAPTRFEGSPRPFASLPLPSPINTMNEPSAQQNSGFGDFDLFIDNISGLYGNGLSSFWVDQTILPPPSARLFPTFEIESNLQHSRCPPPELAMRRASAPHLFDEFTSTLPSFETPSPFKAKKEPWKITQQDWDCLFAEVQKISSTLPPGFFLPSRHTLTRYIATYFSGFHRHLPFIHLPTFSGVNCPLELILAMATIGAQSAFDHENAVMLFRASFAIIQERLRRRKELRHNTTFRAETATSIQTEQNDPISEASSSTGRSRLNLNTGREQTDQLDPLPPAQTLLILMAMATWGNSEAIFDQAVEIQNILVNYVRAEKLLEPRETKGSTWNIWIQEEGFRRTIAIIFCFLMFHTIVYDLPPPILNSELNIHLPSREKDWEAQGEEEWEEARRKHEPEPHFQYIFSSLFSSKSNRTTGLCSSLGSYTLILALIQHIYLLRTVANHGPEGNRELSPTDMADIERALRNWQGGWNQDPESFLGPGSPLGPISFNSTALLRMAYIRLNVDLGPWRALNTHDAYEIANSIQLSPPLMRNRNLTRAVLYSAHALSIPVKIGVNIVTHNQAFSWSLQHSLCALECVFIISKWLLAMEHISASDIDGEEARLYAYIVDMVTEAEAGGEMRSSNSDLCIRVVRIWAKMHSGKAVWDVVRLIGKTLEAYAQILEHRGV